MRELTGLVALLLAAATWPATAQVCRPNNLGSVTCPVPPPEPRPLFEADTQALDRVRRNAADEPGPAFVPAWRTNRLGSTPLDRNELGGAGGRCRADSFGNLRCP